MPRREERTTSPETGYVPKTKRGPKRLSDQRKAVKGLRKSFAKLPPGKERKGGLRAWMRKLAKAGDDRSAAAQKWITNKGMKP